MVTGINRTLLALLMAGGLAVAPGCQETDTYEAQKPAIDDDTPPPVDPAPMDQTPLDQQQPLDQRPMDQEPMDQEPMGQQPTGDPTTEDPNAADNLGQTPQGDTGAQTAPPAGGVTGGEGDPATDDQ